MDNSDLGRVPTAPGSREPDQQAVPALSGFDPSRVYRSQGYAMAVFDQGRDADGAPIREVWGFADEDTRSEGDGWLELRIHEIVETQKSGTIAVYYRQWFAPDGEPAFNMGKPRRRVGSLASVKALINRRKMTVRLYASDDRGLFCKHCGRSRLRHEYVRGLGFACDSDGSPEGGDACGSVHDSAGRETASPTPSSEPRHDQP